MKLTITQEKRGEIERIQREFQKQLSPSEILRSTAQAINGVLSRSISRLKKQIKQEYNITQKYLSRSARVAPKAYSAHLYGGIEINESRIPLVAFRPKQAGSSISVNIHKGKPEIIHHSFIATMSSGHVGVFSRGRYVKKVGFVPGREKTTTGKTRITELYTASVFTMGINYSVANEVSTFMGAELMARVEGILKSKVNKIGIK